VRALKSERRALQHRLAESSSAEALTKQARRLGLVRPGERLYIVKGVSAWLHGTTIERGGR
jgi:cell division protein FtsB